MKISEDSKIHETPLAWIILFGFLGGLILNLMPCVLPVIGLKLLSFLEQSGRQWQRALALNVWYSLGLISVFLVLATLAVTLGWGWGQLFGFAGFDIALAAIVFAMGLSFLGVWEIPIPGFVGRGKTLELAEREGAAGAFIKGILTTLLATPCGAPVLASALTWAVGQPPVKTYAVFLSAGIGMASPYLVIGAFSPLITFIPKPGAWMDTLKEIMGFVLLATVVFLLTFIPWPLVVPTVGFFFGLWGACWWVGRLSPLADGPAKLRRWLSAAIFATAAGFVTLGWLGNVMQERFDNKVEQAIADRLVQGGTLESKDAPKDASRLPWQPFTPKALEEATNAGSTVMVDFTADWCLTCKTLEAVVLNTRPVVEAVNANQYSRDEGRLDAHPAGNHEDVGTAGQQAGAGAGDLSRRQSQQAHRSSRRIYPCHASRRSKEGRAVEKRRLETVADRSRARSHAFEGFDFLAVICHNWGGAFG